MCFCMCWKLVFLSCALISKFIILLQERQQTFEVFALWLMILQYCALSVLIPHETFSAILFATHNFVSEKFGEYVLFSVAKIRMSLFADLIFVGWLYQPYFVYINFLSWCIPAEIFDDYFSWLSLVFSQCLNLQLPLYGMRHFLTWLTYQCCQWS